MKKLFLIFALFVFTLQSAPAIEDGFTLYKDKNVIGIEKSDRAKIKALLNNLNKYSNKHDIEAIKSFYSSNYVNSDGFNRDAFFAAINETFKTYPDISYTGKIKSINIIGEQAAVQMQDKTLSKRQAITQAVINNQPALDNTLNGTMESTCNYIVYLKKVNGKWLIFSDSVISEETTIKYGSANNIKMDITSPLNVREGEEYCISLNVEKEPENTILLASLTREEIKFPPLVPFDKFRKVPPTGVLERVVSANKDGNNEYSLASVGITEVFLNEQRTAINYKMSGIAFLMKRVNVNNLNNAVDQEYIKTLKEKNKETL